MERRSLSASPKLPGGWNIEDGPSFLEILAAQRAARRDSGEVSSRGVDASRERFPLVGTSPGIGFTDVDVPDFDIDEEPESVIAKGRRRPRVFGQGMVEYALLLVLIAVVVMVVLGTVGHQAQDVFPNLSHGLAT